MKPLYRRNFSKFVGASYTHTYTHMHIWVFLPPDTWGHFTKSLYIRLCTYRGGEVWKATRGFVHTYMHIFRPIPNDMQRCILYTEGASWSPYMEGTLKRSWDLCMHTYTHMPIFVFFSTDMWAVLYEGPIHRRLCTYKRELLKALGALNILSGALHAQRGFMKPIGAFVHTVGVSESP